MKSFAIIALSVSALAVAACVPPGARRGHAALKPVSRLDCPESQGDLTRTAMSPDGQTCAYSSVSGGAVQMRLIKVSGDPEQTLGVVESQLRTMMPIPADPAAPAASAAPAAPAVAAEPATPAAPASSSSKRVRTRDGEDVHINLPGMSINANDDRANIRIGGLHIDADDKTGRAHVRGNQGPWGHGGQFTVDADDNGAVIRAKGAGPTVRSTLILASDTAGKDGWKAVGYEARGPRSGPLVVATVQVKTDDHDDVFNDVKRLVRRSAGG